MTAPEVRAESNPLVREPVDLARTDREFQAALKAAERMAFFDERAARQRAADRLDRPRREAAQHAALEEQDQRARDRLTEVLGPELASAVALDSDYVLMQVRHIGVAFTKPTPDDQPKGVLLVGTRSPIYALEQRVQAAAGCGVAPPRIVTGRRLAVDAADVDLVAVDPDDAQLAALVNPTPTEDPTS